MKLLLMFSTYSALMPSSLMLAASLLARLPKLSIHRLWSTLITLSCLALGFTCVTACTYSNLLNMQPWMILTRLGIGMSMLVQLLGTLIGIFSSRYLQGEPRQQRYIAALAGTLAAVHLLLMADHWALLIVLWAMVGVMLQNLLCFYADRPFALLAAHKKRMADRLADALLIGGGALAWIEVGSGSLSLLWTHIGQYGMSPRLQLSAICLVLAVIMRTALLPVHGWLIQVMEAPTPVSALLHAGIINLGGYVLIRFSPMLQQAMPARSLLVCFGLSTACLAGLVMLTRISIKVRLAWSTVAQMGFMLLECGLGLYTLAAMHLLGHSLYKAHAFLMSSTVVRQTHLSTMRGMMTPSLMSLLLAPVMAGLMAGLIPIACHVTAWPWWWCVILGSAWAPLLWLPRVKRHYHATLLQGLSGLLILCILTGATLLAHALPLGLNDAPSQALGIIALPGMTALYVCVAVLQRHPQAMLNWRRWSYAGFYVDEIYTRFAMQRWHDRLTSPALPPTRSPNHSS